MKFPRLSLKAPLSKEQAVAIQYLFDAEGLCMCGRFIKTTDGKFMLGNMIGNFSLDPKNRNLVVIGAFCYGCTQRINDLLRQLKGSFEHNEPDRVRHEGK